LSKVVMLAREANLPGARMVWPQALRIPALRLMNGGNDQERFCDRRDRIPR
jgi:hypothetical protein